MRSATWMLPYLLLLLLSSGAYAALVFLGAGAALVLALSALVCGVVAVVLAFLR